MNQVAQGNAHEVRCDPAIRLYINKVSIATSACLFFKPNKNTITNLLNYLTIRDVTQRRVRVRESVGNLYSYISASSRTVCE